MTSEKPKVTGRGIAVLKALRDIHPGELYAKQIATTVGIDQGAASLVLARLVKGELVEGRRGRPDPAASGRYRFFKITEKGSAFLAALAQDATAEATSAVIQALSADKPGSGYGTEVWMSIIHTDAATFKVHAIKVLGDVSELSGETMRAADWEKIYRIFRGSVAEPPFTVPVEVPAEAMIIGYIGYASRRGIKLKPEDFEISEGVATLNGFEPLAYIATLVSEMKHHIERAKSLDLDLKPENFEYRDGELTIDLIDSDDWIEAMAGTEDEAEVAPPPDIVEVEPSAGEHQYLVAYDDPSMVGRSVDLAGLAQIMDRAHHEQDSPPFRLYVLKPNDPILHSVVPTVEHLAAWEGGVYLKISLNIATPVRREMVSRGQRVRVELTTESRHFTGLLRWWSEEAVAIQRVSADGEPTVKSTHQLSTVSGVFIDEELATIRFKGADANEGS